MYPKENKKKTLSTVYDKQFSTNHKNKTNSIALKTLRNKIDTDGTLKKPNNQTLKSKEVKQDTTANSFKTNDDNQRASNSLYEKEDRIKQIEEKQDSSKQTDEKQKNPEQPRDSINNRYPLNSKNYTTELHTALVKECRDNLLDYNSMTVTVGLESMTNLTQRTLKAIKEQRIFSVLGYFPKISEALKSRGWIEKRDPNRPPINYTQYLKSDPYTVNWIDSPPLISPNITGNDVIWERVKNTHTWSILKDKRSDLIFVTRKRLINWSSLSEMTTVSQMARHPFCSKNGLLQCLEPYKNSVTNLMFPRCHYIRNKADFDEFVEDFIITALVGTLKIIVRAIEENKIIFSETGNIPYEMVDFVKRCVLKYLNKRQTGISEIDLWKLESRVDIWNEYMTHYEKLIMEDDAAFYHKYTYQFELDVYAKCKYLLENVKKCCPQHYIDGTTNTWIIKPTGNCSGHGIIVSRDINKIKEKINVTQDLRNNYIVQKYIEKPLLIYTCKIDLRQWFLVTNMDPIVVWMYKEGYVRFCAKSFSMRNMHESVHLSNVRVQMKYRRIRCTNVPDECMWDFRELQNHLTNIGQGHAWDELIFPGMSESIYAVLQASKDTSHYRPKSFQLFGADFLITENLIPFLIEINSIPGLNPSTSIIANLAPMLLEDIVKVVVDHEGDSNADTGLFVKVVPENLVSTAVDTAETAVGHSERSPFAPPVRQTPVALATVVPNGPDERTRQQWLENLNEKLAEIRSRIKSQKTTTDRYLGYNRDHLLTDTDTSTDANVDFAENTSAARKDILENTLLSPREKITQLKTMYNAISYGTDRDGPSKLSDDQKKR